MAVKQKRNWGKYIVTNITVVMAMIVAWWADNEETLGAVLSADKIVIAGLIISAFNIILAGHDKHLANKKVRKTTNKPIKTKGKASASTETLPTSKVHSDSGSSDGGSSGSSD